jgi:asparagine synthetase B (glutamine-hydrolysing)
MCGIFGLLLKESYNIESDTKDKYKIKHHFKFGEKRGPEYSSIKNMNLEHIAFMNTNLTNIHECFKNVIFSIYHT